MKKINQTTRLAICLTCLLAIMGCEETTKPTPEFDNGQMVLAKVSGDKGMVVGQRCRNGENQCYYMVRFPVKQETTNTRLIAADDAISVAPLALVDWMRPYELEPYEG